MMRVLSIYLIILAFLSLNPWLHPDSSLAIGNIAWDKIDHATAYCILSGGASYWHTRSSWVRNPLMS